MTSKPAKLMGKANEKCKARFHNLIFIVGPTATGKTELSLSLAGRLPAGILNCDSVQMFKGLNIGSAKPVFKKYPHISFFLYDEWEPPSLCSAGDFRKRALQILSRELVNQSLLAVGGSGFYIQALEKGMYPVKKINPEIKHMLQVMREKRGIKHLYFLLNVLDPKYARTISPKDAYRIFRGLSLVLSEQKSVSQIQSSFQMKRLPYPVYKIGLYLPKDELLRRVQIRTKKMLKNGLLDEVQALLDKGWESWSLLNSVGYKECVLFLKNKLSMEKLEERIVQRTMQLAKKQMIWFKRDRGIRWYISDSQWERIYEDIQKYCR